MNSRELEQIRRRWEEFSYSNLPAYKAFLFDAHGDVGALLEEVERLRAARGVRDDGRVVIPCPACRELWERTTLAAIASLPQPIPAEKT